VLDGAHLQAAGMGGDPQLRRTTRANIISLCRTRHRQLHAGAARIEALTVAGADGPCVFSLWRDAAYVEVGRERSLGVFE
jgi:hypothetical protein